AAADRDDRLWPGERSRGGVRGWIRRAHREACERGQDPPRAVRQRGSMNPFEAAKNGKQRAGQRAKANANGNGKSDDTAGAAARARAAGGAGLDHRDILAALRAFKRGDFTAKLREDLAGVDGQIAETFNELVGMAKTIRDEANDVSAAVGKQGQAA